MQHLDGVLVDARLSLPDRQGRFGIAVIRCSPDEPFGDA